MSVSGGLPAVLHLTTRTPSKHMNAPSDSSQSPDAAPTQAQPEPTPTPPQAVAPEQTAPEPAPASLEQEAAAAMKAVMDAPLPAGDSGGAAGEPKKAIRGPRVVQGGREYRKGLVVSVGPDAVFLEFGPKELGVIERKLFTEETLPVQGSELEVVVQRYSAEENLNICVLPGAVQKADWELLEPGQVIEAQVTGSNKGGLELQVAKHRAFMPASQIDVVRIDDMKQFVGQKLKCRVMRVDRMGRGNITLSRRALMADVRKEQAGKLKDTLKEGDTITGTISKIMPFGAFVDMGGIDGLLHVSDMSHERMAKVEDIVKEGETVEVKILKLDWEKKRHSLGLKQLTADPWVESTSAVKEGEVISGKVTKLMEFGAFVEVAPGVEGLVHISELAWQRIAKTSDAVQPNSVVSVKVIKVDTDSRKISLSIKQASDRPVMKGSKPGRGGKRGMEQDTRTAEEILAETPAMRRAREKAKQKGLAPGGLGDAGGLGIGLGDLSL